jgi:hypothetical protein
MKYKVGDAVRIRSKEWFDAQEKDEDGYIKKDGLLFVPNMLRYAGQIARITRVSQRGNFNLDINDGSDGSTEYAWAEWMFDPDYNPSKEPLSAKDAIEAMLAGETLYDGEGREWRWDESKCSFKSLGTGNVMWIFKGLYRRPVKHKRLMTRWEILGWINSEESRGWVITLSASMPTAKSGWHSPQFIDYASNDIEHYWRARLLPDLSGIDESTIQGFEVEDEE